MTWLVTALQRARIRYERRRFGHIVTARLLVTNTHDARHCAGQTCIIHRPTKHHLRRWEVSWRGDRELFERHCPAHGTGHPDPDQFGFWEITGQEHQGVHGCCGCCWSAKQSTYKGNESRNAVPED